jgi:hypothetical protein
MHKKALLTLLILFFSPNLYAQNNLVLINNSKATVYFIPKGKTLKLGIKGFDHVVKGKLVDVNDSGIVFSGLFNKSNTVEKRFIPIKIFFLSEKLPCSI